MKFVVLIFRISIYRKQETTRISYFVLMKVSNLIVTVTEHTIKSTTINLLHFSCLKICIAC